jgi:effector-binding domain-containing protein
MLQTMERDLSEFKITGERGLLKDIPTRTIAYMKCRGSWRQLPGALGSLERLLTDNSLKAVGPPSGVYYNTSAEVNIEDLEWEVFYPVYTRRVWRITGGWEFGVRRLPGTRVAFLHHQGPYRAAGSTYRRLEGWIIENGWEIGGPSEEVYLTDFTVPESKMLVEIRIPIRSS